MARRKNKVVSRTAIELALYKAGYRQINGGAWRRVETANAKEAHRGV